MGPGMIGGLGGLVLLLVALFFGSIQAQLSIRARNLE
jgi:hypothetical protein